MSLMTKKHVKNYQNKLFFVPNLGVKPTKNRNVRSWCGSGTFRVWSKRCPLEDHIVDILQVACSVLVPQLRPPSSSPGNRVVFPSWDRKFSIVRCYQTSFDPMWNYHPCHIFYKSWCAQRKFIFWLIWPFLLIFLNRQSALTTFRPPSRLLRPWSGSLLFLRIWCRRQP